MLKRPNPNEDEDEILRQQEEFLRQKLENKIKPAATVVSQRENENSNLNSSNQSEGSPKLKNDSVDKMDVDPQQDSAEINIQEQIANTFEAIPTDMNLKQVTEKHDISRNRSNLKSDCSGFPKAVRRDPDLRPTKGSIFSQHIKRIKRTNDHSSTNTSLMKDGELSLVVKERQIDMPSYSISKQHTLVTSRFKAPTAHQSTILNEADKQAIHKESINTLNSMSEEEILAEKERLMTTLDPAIVQFIKSQRSKKVEENQNRNKTIKEQNEAAENIQVEELETPKEIIDMTEMNDWLHFDQIEINKLAWMKDIKIPSSAQDVKKAGFEARFDMNGYLLPFEKEINEENRHLYHHGDEPDRPGYTLQELLLLSRSQVVQQKVMALNTIANILAVNQTGMYDDVLDLPIEQIFFVLRIAVDDNTHPVLNAGLKALRNLIYFRVDETCVDNLLNFGIGLVQPTIAIDYEIEDDNTVNDQQLAETNLIKCLVRSNIITRIRYVVNILKPQIETMVCCLEILIRLARDSVFAINKIFACEGLLTNLINNFMPRSSLTPYNSGYPLWQMVKLLRVLSARSKTLAVALIERNSLMECVKFYLYDARFGTNATGLRLQIEVMHYWTLLLRYGISHALSESDSIIQQFLYFHFTQTHNSLTTPLIRHSHLSAVLILIAELGKRGKFVDPNLLSNCFSKFTVEFTRFENFECARSQITTALFYCAAVYNRHSVHIYGNGHMESFLTSRFLKDSSLVGSSLLVNDFKCHQTSANLKSMKAACFDLPDHVIPLFNQKSSLPLLYSLSCCILTDRREGLLKIKKQFLTQPEILSYLEKLSTSKKYYNVGTWFTRCETFFIMNILKMAESVDDTVNLVFSEYFNVAVKCLSVFNHEQKVDMEFLLEKVIFNSRFHGLHVGMMMQTLIDNPKDQFNIAWKHLDDIKDLYTNTLGLTKNPLNFEDALSLDFHVGHVLPIDWIYLPIQELYTKRKKMAADPKDEEKEVKIVANCLRWILIYEKCFSELANAISPAEKYVKLSCLFLGSDSLFLHYQLQLLLPQVYGFLINKLNLEVKIPGFSSFKDFYTQLLEQYQAVSYRNRVFGNIILFPLTKNHDVKYRKMLWSEYVGAVQMFGVAKDETWLDPDTLINPPDTDASLCVCYQDALQKGLVPRGTVLYDIAETSVLHFTNNLIKKGKEQKILKAPQLDSGDGTV